VRDAALDLAGGGKPLPREALMARAVGSGFAEETVKKALSAHTRHPEGVLSRVHVGLYRLRDGLGVAPTARAGDWVLEALLALGASPENPVSRRQVEGQLAEMGLRYSERAVNKGLTQLVRDSGSGVDMPRRGRYVMHQ
jgi:hypothetical protein